MTTNIQLRKQALDREEFRLQQIANAIAGLPRNKSGRFKGTEANMLFTLVNHAHKTLCAYDVEPDPAPLAGITETWFDAAIERLHSLGNEKLAANPSLADGDNGKADD